MRRLTSLVLLVALSLAAHAVAQSQAINGAIEGVRARRDGRAFCPA